MLTKMKNIRKKFKNFFFSKMKKTSGHMAQGKPQPKFERNPCNNFTDNRCHRWTDDGRTDGWRTTDEFRFHELCWHSQAELKSEVRHSINYLDQCRALSLPTSSDDKEQTFVINDWWCSHVPCASFLFQVNLPSTDAYLAIGHLHLTDSHRTTDRKPLYLKLTLLYLSRLYRVLR